MIKHTIIPAGGLGNRIRVILSALQWQKDTGKNVRILWIQDEGLACSFEKLFMPITEVKERRSLLCYKFFRKIYLHSPLRYIYAYNYNEYENLREWIKNPNGLLYSTSYSIFYNGSYPQYHDVFRLNADLQKQLDEYRSQMGKNTIGIHIRRTDNLESIQHSPIQKFIDFIHSAIQENDTQKFYLATDDQVVKEEFIQLFGDKIMTMDCVLRRDSEEGIKCALLELYILSSCAKIIGSYYSSYSELAAQIGNIPLIIL